MYDVSGPRQHAQFPELVGGLTCAYVVGTPMYYFNMSRWTHLNSRNNQARLGDKDFLVMPQQAAA